jgi:hypothetical protein
MWFTSKNWHDFISAMFSLPIFWLFVPISSYGTYILAQNQSMVKILAIIFSTQPIAILAYILANKFGMPIF